MNDPFLAHSEITNEIYIIYGKKKYCVTEQVISAMKATGRLNERLWGKWIITEIKCPNCLEYFHDYSFEELKKCPNCGADMRGEEE